MYTERSSGSPTLITLAQRGAAPDHSSRTSLMRPGNFMGATSMGSFAAVGDSITRHPTDFAPRSYLAVEIGEVCQLKCRHCIYHRPKSRSPRPNSDVLEEVATTVDSSFHPIWVTLAGKEPTIFPKQLRHSAARLSHPERLSILMTNGLLLRDALIDDLAAHIDLFDISVDGTEKAHDWMRGPGTYLRTWERIDAVLSRTESRVGVIATAVHADIGECEHQNGQIVDLARKIVAEYGDHGRILLSISLYYGFPDDPLRLNGAEISALIEGLQGSGCPTRVLFTANYSHLWPEVSRSLGVTEHELEYDVRTGFPLVRLGNVLIILFNLTKVPQISTRVSNDGLVYLGCNHLILGDDAANHAIADLSHTHFVDAISQIAEGTHPIYAEYTELAEECARCPDLGLCAAGDRLSGHYFNREAVDPFCERISRSTTRG